MHFKVQFNLNALEHYASVICNMLTLQKRSIFNSFIYIKMIDNSQKGFPNSSVCGVMFYKQHSPLILQQNRGWLLCSKGGFLPCVRLITVIPRDLRCRITLSHAAYLSINWSFVWHNCWLTWESNQWSFGYQCLAVQKKISLIRIWSFSILFPHETWSTHGKQRHAVRKTGSLNFK